jgi:glycosyltransferase involved in cell wall biosynthesis
MQKVTTSPNLSVVLPAYNEGPTISLVIARTNSVAKKTGLKYELIVVDDGSEDNTRTEILRSAKRNMSVKVVGYTKNLGKGFAVKTGFFTSLGDQIIFLDSDADVEPDRVADFVQALKNADVVIASKRHPDSIVHASLARKFLSFGFNKLVRLLVGLDIKDTQVGLKALNRSALQRVFPLLSVKRYAFDVELLAVSKLLGLKIVELPVNLRLTGSFSIREVFRMFVDVLGIAYRLRITKYYQRNQKILSKLDFIDFNQRL